MSIKIYLSASISNALNNQYIADVFPQDKFEIFLPQKIVPTSLSHTSFPLDVYQGCLTMMEASNLCLVLLDSYGRDCAWECGWYTANPDRYLVAFVESSSHFSRDWMIKGGIDLIVTTNPRLFDLISHDPILKLKSQVLISNVEELPAQIESYHKGFQSNR